MSSLVKQIEPLKLDIAQRRAMTLDRYNPPLPLDMKAALDASTEKTRFGQPVAHAYHIVSGKPAHGWFNPSRDSEGKLFKDSGPWFTDPVLAMIHNRNDVARQYASRLLRLDAEIDEMLVGSGVIPGVIMTASTEPAPERVFGQNNVTSGEIGAAPAVDDDVLGEATPEAPLDAGWDAAAPAPVENEPSTTAEPKKPTLNQARRASKKPDAATIKAKADKAEAASNAKRAKEKAPSRPTTKRKG